MQKEESNLDYDEKQKLNSFIQQQKQQLETMKTYSQRLKEDFQKNKISSFVYCKIVDDCLKNNIDNIWIYTNYKNIPNQKSLEKIGFIKDEIIYSIKFGNKFYKVVGKKL